MCDRCAALEAEVIGLKRQLGLELFDEHVVALRDSGGLTPNEGRLMLALYEARPRTLSRGHLCDLLQRKDHAIEPYLKVIDVMVCKIRRKIGADKIDTVWGAGLRISPHGAAWVLRAIATEQESAAA